jgi:hypothetical protein
MTWTYTYHRFANRAAFDAAYDAAGFARTNGPIGFPPGTSRIAPPLTVTFDVCGALYDRGVCTPDGVTIIEPSLLSGFHVNAAWAGAMPAAFNASQIFPTAPRRVFA